MNNPCAAEVTKKMNLSEEVYLHRLSSMYLDVLEGRSCKAKASTLETKATQCVFNTALRTRTRFEDYTSGGCNALTRCKAVNLLILLVIILQQVHNILL